MATKKFGSSLLEAYKDHQEKVEIPQIYLQSLYFAQFFEFSLEQLLKMFIQRVQKKLREDNLDYNPKMSDNFTSKDYITRLETFLPKHQNDAFYKAIREATEKRNDFIHQSFKVNGPDGSPYINIDMDKFYLEKDALRAMREWLHTFPVANREIMKITERFIEETKSKATTALAK